MERKRKKDYYYYGKDHFFVMILLSCLLLLSTLVLKVESFNIEPLEFYGDGVVKITLNTAVAKPAVFLRTSGSNVDDPMTQERSSSDNMIHVFSFTRSNRPTPSSTTLRYWIVVENYTPVEILIKKSPYISGFSTSYLLTGLQDVVIDIYGDGLIPISSFSNVIEVSFMYFNRMHEIPCTVLNPTIDITDTSITCTLASTPNTPTTLEARIKYQPLFESTNQPNLLLSSSPDYTYSISSIYVQDLILTSMNPTQGYSGQTQLITFTANVNTNSPINNLLQIVFIDGQAGNQYDCGNPVLSNNGLVTCTLPIIPNITPGTSVQLSLEYKYGTSTSRISVPFTFLTYSSQIATTLPRKLIITGSEYVTITGTFFDQPTMLTIDGVVCNLQPPTPISTDITCMTTQFPAAKPSATLLLTIGKQIIQLLNAFEIENLRILSVPSFALYDSNNVPVTTTMRIGFTGIIPRFSVIKVTGGSATYSPPYLRVISNVLSFDVSSAGFTAGASCQIKLRVGRNGPTIDVGQFQFKNPVITIDPTTPFQSFILNSNKVKIDLKTNVGETFQAFKVELVLVTPARDTIVVKGNVLPNQLNTFEFDVPSYSLDTIPSITKYQDASCTIRIDNHDYPLLNQIYRYTVPEITQIEYKRSGFEMQGINLDLGPSYTTKFMLDDIDLGLCTASSSTLVVCSQYVSSTNAKTILLIVDGKIEFKFDLSTGAGITIVGPVATEIKPRLSQITDRSDITIRGTGFTAQSLSSVTIGGKQLKTCTRLGTTDIICGKPPGLQPNPVGQSHQITIDGVIQSDISYITHIVSCLGQSIGSSIDPQHYDYLPKKWWFNYRLATTKDDYFYADEEDQNLRHFFPLNTHTDIKHNSLYKTLEQSKHVSSKYIFYNDQIGKFDPENGVKKDARQVSDPYGHTKGFVIWQEHSNQIHGVHVLHSNPAFPPEDYTEHDFPDKKPAFLGEKHKKQHYFCRPFIGLAELDTVADYIIINNANIYKIKVPQSQSTKMLNIDGAGATNIENCIALSMGPNCINNFPVVGGTYFAKTAMTSNLSTTPLPPVHPYDVLAFRGNVTQRFPKNAIHYPTEYLHQSAANNHLFLTFYTAKPQECDNSIGSTSTWKYRYCYPFGGVDTWEYAARTLGTQLFVQTFRNSHALIPSPYLINVSSKIIYPGIRENIDTADHSKIAYTFLPTSRGGTTGDWFCVGDSNREYSQPGRGGGAFCFQSPTLVDQFHRAVTRYKLVAPIDTRSNTMIEYGISHTRSEDVERASSVLLSIQLDTSLTFLNPTPNFQNPVTVALYESVSYKVIQPAPAPRVFQDYKLIPYETHSFYGSKKIRYNALRTTISPRGFGVPGAETPFSQISNILPPFFTPPEELVAKKELKVEYYANDDSVASLVDSTTIHQTCPSTTKVIVLNGGTPICQEEQTYLLLLAYYHNRTIQEQSQVLDIFKSINTGSQSTDSQKTFINGILLALTRTDDYLKIASAFWKILMPVPPVNPNPNLSFDWILKALSSIKIQDEGIDTFEKFYAKQENILKSERPLFETLQLLQPAPDPNAGILSRPPSFPNSRTFVSSSSSSSSSLSISHILEVLSENYPNNYDVDSITRELYGSGSVQSTYYSDLKGALDKWINIQDKNQGVQTLFVDILSNTQTLGAIEMLDNINSNQHGVDIDIRTSQSGIKFIASLSTIVQITTLLVSFRSHPSTLVKKYGKDFELYFVPQMENGGDEGFLVATLNNKLCDLQKNTRTNFELPNFDLSSGICRQSTDIITSVTPLSGSTVGGYSIDIGGIHFSSNSKVKIGKTICQSTLFISTTMLKCIVPPGIGNNHIVSTVSSSIGILSRFHFNYNQPIINEIQSPTLTSNFMTISGNNFGNNALNLNIKIGKSDCSIVSIQNDLIICLPASNDFGVDRTVSIQQSTNSLYTTNLNKANIDTSLVTFRPPIIHSVSPSTTVHVGQTIYLYGKYFGLKNSDIGPHVTINKQKCQVLDYSPEVITFIVPKGSGSSQIVVNVGGQTATMPVTYDIPYVDFVTPKLFNTSGGQVMRIEGNSLGSSIYDIDSIYFAESMQCQPFNLLMECTIPAGVGKDIQLSGTINGKTMTPWNSNPLLASYLPPSIASAIKFSGNQLSIKGYNFIPPGIEASSSSVILYTSLQSYQVRAEFQDSYTVVCTSPYVSSALGVAVIINGQLSSRFDFDVSIVGRIYLDMDHNNIHSQGDQTTNAQVTITLTSTDGQFTQSVVTDTSEYMFSEIPLGDYKIKATSSSIIFPRDTFSISLIANSGIKTVDFGGYTKVGIAGTVTYNQETLNIQNNINVGWFGWCFTTECQVSYSFNIPWSSSIYISSTTGQIYLYILYEDLNLNLVLDANEPNIRGALSKTTISDGITTHLQDCSSSVCTFYCPKSVCTITFGQVTYSNPRFTSIYSTMDVEFNTMSMVDQRKDINIAYYNKDQYPRSTRLDTTNNGAVNLPIGVFPLAMTTITRVVPTPNTIVHIVHQGVTYSYTQATDITLSPAAPITTVSVSPLGILQGIVLAPYGQTFSLPDIFGSAPLYISVNEKIDSFPCQLITISGRTWYCGLQRLGEISPNARIFIKTNDWLLNSYPVSLTTVTVSGLVFHDTNLNGIYEIGEKIIPGVRLEIYNVPSSFTFSTSTGYTMQTKSFNQIKALQVFGPTSESFPPQSIISFYQQDSPSFDFTSFTINVPLTKINLKCNGYLISGTNQIEFVEGIINLSNYAGWCLEGQTCQYPITSVSMPPSCIRANNNDNTISIIEGFNIRVDLYEDLFIGAGSNGLYPPLVYPMLVRTSYSFQGKDISLETLVSSTTAILIPKNPGQLTTISIVAPPQSSHQYAITNNIKIDSFNPLSTAIQIGITTKPTVIGYMVELYDVQNTVLTLPMGVYKNDILTRLSWNNNRARKIITFSPDVVVLIFKSDSSMVGPFIGTTNNNVFTIPTNTDIYSIEVAHKNIFNTIVPTEGGYVRLPANPFQSSRSLSLHLEGVQLKCSEVLICLFPTVPASDRQLVVKLQPGNIQLYTTYTITYPVRYPVPTIPGTYLDANNGPNTLQLNERLTSITMYNRFTNVVLKQTSQSIPKTYGVLIESVDSATTTVIESYSVSNLKTLTLSSTSLVASGLGGSSSTKTILEGITMRYFSTHPDGAMIQDQLGRVLWARLRASITEFAIYGPLGSGLGYLDCLDPTRNQLLVTQTIGNDFYTLFVHPNYGVVLKDRNDNQEWTQVTYLPTVQTKLVFYADGDLCSVDSAGVKGWCTYTSGLGGRYFLVAPTGYAQGFFWQILMLNANGHVVWARYSQDGTKVQYSMLPGSYMVAGQALRNGQFLTNGLVYMVYDAIAGYIKYYREPPTHPNKVLLSQTQCIGNILLLSGTTPQCFNDQDTSQLSTVTTTLAYWGLRPSVSVSFETQTKTTAFSWTIFTDHSFSPLLQDLIQGQVFIDLNRNNIMDQNEVGVLGVAVSIGVSSTTSDQRGFFSLRSHQYMTEKLKFINIPSQYYTPIPEFTLYQNRFNRDIPLYQKGNCYGYLNSNENSKLYLDIGSFRLSDFGWCTLNKACANRVTTYSFPDQCLVVLGDNNLSNRSHRYVYQSCVTTPQADYVPSSKEIQDILDLVYPNGPIIHTDTEDDDTDTSLPDSSSPPTLYVEIVNIQVNLGFINVKATTVVSHPINNRTTKHTKNKDKKELDPSTWGQATKVFLCYAGTISRST
ncbi:hypothetical protein DFA_06767 [Cavenderia fasciculata]|uniref:IPT/TIG domain-containing protein n=1 Tax=Cavenderia fasciculata TaxID=261658 RepID=F4Q280_CACFS|nr:uncharacterized protein DFA_06767 [Cavenderia fasciculata]EGG18100.1 hypothetical protein DFA_06767 [Cavenderia fasciculata]|eukprot:XP_004366141.1 hypothetical protein DFA_06767 [Cavenderia fasciculata]